MTWRCVLLLDEQPVVLLPGETGADEGKAPRELLARDLDLHRAHCEHRLEARVSPRPERAAIPDDDSSRAVLALRDRALEAGVVQRMVLDLDGEPPVRRIEARPLRNGPTLEDAAGFQAQIVVQVAGVVFLNDIYAVRARGRCGHPIRPGGLGGYREVALGMVAAQTGAPVSRGCLRLLARGTHAGQDDTAG